MTRRLREGGALVAITPRSFASGEYFRRFREVLFEAALPKSSTSSRPGAKTLRADSVFQENVIMRARRSAPPRAARVAVSVSAGASDLARSETRSLPLSSVLDRTRGSSYVHVPVNRLDDDVLALVRKWPETLSSLGLRVSTGPVVAFRATDFLRSRPDDMATPFRFSGCSTSGACKSSGRCAAARRSTFWCRVRRNIFFSRTAPTLCCGGSAPKKRRVD
jgi:adenine-specific DNA-methyltransferase